MRNVLKRRQNFLKAHSQHFRDLSVESHEKLQVSQLGRFGLEAGVLMTQLRRRIGS